MADAAGRVPVIVVEEHHEAFFVWHRAISSGWMKPAGNTLLHLDEHHDLSVPVLRTPLCALRTAEEVARFTYGELGIGCFIWPAVYTGVFEQFFWMRRSTSNPTVVERFSIRSKDERQLEFVIRPTREHANLNIIRVGPGDTVYPPGEFVLDIDLDYFVCNKPRPRFEIEITEGAYQRYLDDPYYYLRIPSPEVTVEKREDSYVIVLGDDPVADDDQATVEDIEQRIDAVCRYLRVCGSPSVVVICRSVHSGYTPAALAAYLERRLVERLAEIFSVREIAVSELLPDGMALHSLLSGHHHQPT